MKFTIAILAALLIATGAFAQDRGGGAITARSRTPKRNS